MWDGMLSLPATLSVSMFNVFVLVVGRVDLVGNGTLVLVSSSPPTNALPRASLMPSFKSFAFSLLLPTLSVVWLPLWPLLTLSRTHFIVSLKTPEVLLSIVFLLVSLVLLSDPMHSSSLPLVLVPISFLPVSRTGDNESDILGGELLSFRGSNFKSPSFDLMSPARAVLSSNSANLDFLPFFSFFSNILYVLTILSIEISSVLPPSSVDSLTFVLFFSSSSLKMLLFSKNVARSILTLPSSSIC
mmetsp:Transcript_15676/g.37655  ORF Transcript_15676/g.37655 Transcript_15676/m.37655 type:complete len:244 (-) Transcript_15676:2249-2980(-)